MRSSRSLAGQGYSDLFERRARREPKAIHYLIERPSIPLRAAITGRILIISDFLKQWTPLVIYINFVVLFSCLSDSSFFSNRGRAPLLLHFADLASDSLFCFPFFLYAARYFI